MRAPEFWRHDGVVARMLSPLGWAYRAGTMARIWTTESWRAPVPVICVGNLIAGGAGKTPVALSIAGRLEALGVAPHFLTRGFGGGLAGPLQVDPAIHGARDVGDESLLLARRAATWLSRDRAAGARAAAAAGAGAIVMDDGFQNPSLEKDLALVVVDGSYGFGNARVIPAGPLREPVALGLERADAVVVIGTDASGVEALLPDGLMRLRARLVPAIGSERVAGKRVVAFAGIGRPEKFFTTLAELGCPIVHARAFPDHHRYDELELMTLAETAAREGATLVTTAKDHVRLPPEARDMVETVEIDVEWEDVDALTGLLRSAAGDRNG